MQSSIMRPAQSMFSRRDRLDAARAFRAVRSMASLRGADRGRLSRLYAGILTALRD